MCIGIVWHELEQGDRRCVPGEQRRYLVAQDDGYIEMAEWNGKEFIHDWPPTPYGMPTPSVPRVRYWCDLPETPTEDGDSPF